MILERRLSLAGSRWNALGTEMSHANARSQQPLMFAALLTLAVVAVALYFAMDAVLRRALPWQAETDPSLEKE